jgi:hypothetical protein
MATTVTPTSTFVEVNGLRLLNEPDAAAALEGFLSTPVAG